MRESIVEDYIAVTVQDHSEQLIRLTNGITHVTHSSSADRYKPLACIGMPGGPLTYPSAKPLREQLKQAFENGCTLSCHRKTFSLSLCGFFSKDSWCSNAIMFSWPNHRIFTCRCTAIVPTTSQGQLMTLMTERMELCWQDGRRRTRLYWNSTSGKMRRHSWQQRLQQVAWQMLRAFIWCLQTCFLFVQLKRNGTNHKHFHKHVGESQLASFRQINKCRQEEGEKDRRRNAVLTWIDMGHFCIDLCSPSDSVKLLEVHGLAILSPLDVLTNDINMLSRVYHRSGGEFFLFKTTVERIVWKYSWRRSRRTETSVLLIKGGAGSSFLKTEYFPMHLHLRLLDVQLSF